MVPFEELDLRSDEAAHRQHLPAGERLGGSGTWKAINATIDQLGIEVMLNTAGKKLHINDAGEVIRLLAQIPLCQQCSTHQHRRWASDGDGNLG